MSIFKPVTFEWNGDKYTIEANNILPLIATIESKLTFMELAAAMQNQIKMPAATLSQVYGMVLRHAGCAVTDEDVYGAMFEDDTKANVMAGVQTLMVMMTPPGVYDKARKKVEANERAVTKALNGKKAAGSSNRATKRSAAAKARRSSPVISGS